MSVTRCYSLHDSAAYSCAQSERGAILILLAVLAVVLITFVGLGVDTSLLGATKRDTANLSPRVAAASLNAYSTATGTPSQRLNVARVRGQDIAQANVDIATTSAFLKGGHAAATQDLGAGATWGETGRIVPGYWHYYPTLQPPYYDAGGICVVHNDAKCPCADDGSWNGPCFEPVEDISTLGAPGKPSTITAMRAQLKLRNDAPLKTRFMGAVGGPKEFVITASATLAQRSLRTVMIVDLSRHMHEETHLPYEIIGAGTAGRTNPAEAAYRVIDPSKCQAGEPKLPVPTIPTPAPSYTQAYMDSVEACPIDMAATCATGIASPALRPLTCSFAGGWSVGGVNGLYTAMFNHFCPSNQLTYPPLRSVTAHPLQLHAKGDFRCLPVTWSEDGAPKAATYLVDLYRGITRGGVVHNGPEPLTSMLTGIDRGLEKFRQRRIEGDKVMIFGADQSVEIDKRTFAYGPARDGETVFDEARATFAPGASLLKRNQEHFFFPREDALFNLPEAVKRAYATLIAEPDYLYVDNEVIVFTNGQSNCSENMGTGKSECDRDQQALQKSIEEAVSIVTQNFRQARIRFSVILMGEASGGHTLVRKGKVAESLNRCMTDSEARENSDAYVNFLNYPAGDSQQDNALNQSVAGANYADGGATFVGQLNYPTKYFYPNKLYDAVAATGGTWGPIRRPCLPAGQVVDGKACSAGGLKEYLDKQCAALPNPGQKLANFTEGGAPITDADGRLLCDPTCSAKTGQINDLIDKIFDRNPYLPVENSVITD